MIGRVLPLGHVLMTGCGTAQTTDAVLVYCSFRRSETVEAAAALLGPEWVRAGPAELLPAGSRLGASCRTRIPNTRVRHRQPYCERNIGGGRTWGRS